MKEIFHEHQTEIVYSDIHSFFSTPEYVAYRKLWNDRPKNLDPGNFPVNLDVSVTNHCNLGCIMCKRTIALADPAVWNSGTVIDPELKFIEFDVYKKVIDEGAKNGLQAVHLTGHDGEPTLHKQLPEMIAYARSKGICDVFTHSNATLLHLNNRIDDILMAQPHRIIFSVDSPVKETYETIRVGAKFEIVLENIRKFIARKKELGFVFPIVKVQMVVMEKNKQDVQRFKELFRDESQADVLGFTEFVNYHDIIESKKDENVKRAVEAVFDNHYVCDYPYRRIRLDQSGYVYACLTGQHHKLGHAKYESISSMWHGKYLTQLRDAHLKVGAGKTPGCETCGRQWTAEKLIAPKHH